MKAVLFERYGSPDFLRLAEVPTPSPGKGEVQVRVRAASVNSWDWELLHAVPWVNRATFGWTRPHRIASLGADVAGEVAAVGPGVTRFREGDAVYGDLSGAGWGGFAEYLCARADALLPKPEHVSFEQAAAIPQAGAMAVQSLFGEKPVTAGMRVLVNGAGGGVGTFVVQLARQAGAEVTAVDSAPKLEMLRGLGAAHVVDYTREDFADGGQTYDLIVDPVARRSVARIRRVLAPGGAYVLIGGRLPQIFWLVVMGRVLSRVMGRRFSVLLLKANVGLERITRLMAEEKLAPAIERVYPLEETAAALRHLGEGRVLGKVVVTP